MTDIPAKRYHMTRDVYVTRGDDCKLTMVFHTNGTAVDITSYNFWLTAKNHEGDADADAAVTVNPADVTKADSGSGTTDTAIITLTSAKTDITERSYPFDIQMKTAAGEIKTIRKGDLHIEPGRTDRTT